MQLYDKSILSAHDEGDGSPSRLTDAGWTPTLEVDTCTSTLETESVIYYQLCAEESIRNLKDR